MQIKQMKDWLNKLPVEFDEYPIAILHNISPIENSQNGSVILKDRHITLCIINDQMKKAFLLDDEVSEKFNKYVAPNGDITNI
jgi:hypothetical protein